MYTAEIDVTSAKIKQLFRAGAKLEMQGLVDAILRDVLDKEIERDKKRCEAVFQQGWRHKNYVFLQQRNQN